MQFLIKNYDKTKVSLQILAVNAILENNCKHQDTMEKLKREEELNIGISKENWREMNQNVHTTTVLLYWRE